MSRWLVTLILFFTSWVTCFCAAGAERLPVPDEKALEKAQGLLREVYKDSLSSRDSAGRLELSKMMLAQAAELEDDPAGKYALLTQARDLAAEAGDVSASLSAAEELARVFAVGSAETKLAGLPAASKAKDVRALAEALIDISNEALAEEDFPVAGKAASLAASAARRARGDKGLAARARAQPAVVARARQSAEAAAQAKVKLSTDPDDPAANTTLGRYLCFERGDWEVGLGHLAKGSDASLKALAAQEVPPPQNPAAMAALAERWWTAADQAEKAEAQPLRRRAVYWYERALPDLRGIRKTAAEKRLASADASAAGDATPAKVLRLVAVVDGMDRIELTNAEVKWVHVSWSAAADVRLNGAAWDINKLPVLKNLEGITKFLSRIPSFAHTSVKKIRGRGDVSVKADAKKAVITINDEGPFGADTYEIEVTFDRRRGAEEAAR